jgi:hypothetical protein
MGLEEAILTQLMEGDDPQEIANALELEQDMLDELFENLWDAGLLSCQLHDL